MCWRLMRSHDVFRQINFNRYNHSVAVHCKAVDVLLKQWENGKQLPIVFVENKESDETVEARSGAFESLAMLQFFVTIK